VLIMASQDSVYPRPSYPCSEEGRWDRPRHDHYYCKYVLMPEECGPGELNARTRMEQNTNFDG